MRKKMIAVVTAAVMVLTFVPSVAFAETEAEDETAVTETEVIEESTEPASEPEETSETVEETMPSEEASGQPQTNGDRNSTDPTVNEKNEGQIETGIAEAKGTVKEINKKALTAEEANRLITNYLKKSGKNYKIGTGAYCGQLTDMLMFWDEKDWKKIDSIFYNELQTYACEYVITVSEKPEEIAKGKMPKSLKGKTTGNLRKARQQKNAKTETLAIRNMANEKTISVCASREKYSRTKAVDYALKWSGYMDGEVPHHNWNSKYPNWIGSDSDCTNYVSQCVLAGGKVMKAKKPAHSWYGADNARDRWFVKKYKYGNKRMWKWSVSWTTVDGFFTKWYKYSIQNSRGVVRIYKSAARNSALQNKLRKGDILQLRNGGGWYHSVIITGGKKGNWTYCGHTNPRHDQKVSTIRDTNAYRIIRIGGDAGVSY